MSPICEQLWIQEFQKVFNMTKTDGFIDRKDSHDILASLEKNSAGKYLDVVINKAIPPLISPFFSACLLKS
ncbi:hypothetical protein LEMLEM_LOCUS1490 [Lemmus lemmus]